MGRAETDVFGEGSTGIAELKMRGVEFIYIYIIVYMDLLNFDTNGGAWSCQGSRPKDEAYHHLAILRSLMRGWNGSNYVCLAQCDTLRHISSQLLLVPPLLPC